MRDFEYTLRKLRKCLYLYIAETEQCGFGVFTAREFKRGETIFVDEDGDYLDGLVFSYTELRSIGYGLENTLQVGIDAFKLPGGTIDDFTNHSCEPNTGVRLTDKGTLVLALRDIIPREQLTYDYSTYMNNPYEVFECLCGAARCRRTIGNFSTLPPDLQRRYQELGVVGDFVETPIEALDVAD